MEEFTLILQDWHWLVLALLLIGAETLGTGGFLIGLALAAFLMSVLIYFLDITWQWQLVYYALTSLLFTWVYWRFFRGFNDKTDQPTINDRAAQLIGRRLILDEPIMQGQCRVQIGDTRWKIKAAQDYPVGTEVEVIKSEGMELLVKQYSVD